MGYRTTWYVVNIFSSLSCCSSKRIRYPVNLSVNGMEWNIYCSVTWGMHEEHQIYSRTYRPIDPANFIFQAVADIDENMGLVTTQYIAIFLFGGVSI